MNKRNLTILLVILLAVLLLVPIFGKENEDRGNQRRKKRGRDNHERTTNHIENYNYQYHGQYRNFEDNNHVRRYYWQGRYYSFPEYYRFYYREGNYYTYEGKYDRFSNVFIFTDKYGNEFDLYIPPVRRLPARYGSEPLYPGDSFRIRVKPYRWYPPRNEVSVGLRLDFGWGAINLQKGRYFDIHTTPDLINYRGELYID